jgi:hypothetical protein
VEESSLAPQEEECILMVSDERTLGRMLGPSRAKHDIGKYYTKKKLIAYSPQHILEVIKKKERNEQDKYCISESLNVW